MLRRILPTTKAPARKDADVPLDELAEFEDEAATDRTEELQDTVMEEALPSPPAVASGSSDLAASKAKKPRKKRGKYNKYNKEQVMTALRLLYIDKIGREKTAEQTKIPYKTLNGLINYYVKERNYPKVPRSAPKKLQKAYSVREDPEIDQFFESYIKPRMDDTQ